MISYLEGKLIDKTENSATVLVGGVGYEVFLTPVELKKTSVGEEVKYFIYTHVREDILALYGFCSQEEMQFFRLLLSVSGVGPKVALLIIGSAPIEKIKGSIAKGDPALLSAVSGVGKKTAEKAVIELKGKMGNISRDSGIIRGDETDEVYGALLALGFQNNEIADALTQLPENISGSEAKIKAVLKRIGKRK
jgi:Holliday junction DNA helicase RuvA